MSACRGVIRGGILQSLQGITFSCDWQVSVSFLCWPLSGACPRVLKSTSTNKMAPADMLVDNSGLFFTSKTKIPPKHLVIFPPKSLQNFYHWACAAFIVSVITPCLFPPNPSKSDPELLSMCNLCKCIIIHVTYYIDLATYTRCNRYCCSGSSYFNIILIMST